MKYFVILAVFLVFTIAARVSAECECPNQETGKTYTASTDSNGCIALTQTASCGAETANSYCMIVTDSCDVCKEANAFVNQTTFEGKTPCGICKQHGGEPSTVSQPGITRLCCNIPEEKQQICKEEGNEDLCCPTA